MGDDPPEDHDEAPGTEFDVHQVGHALSGRRLDRETAPAHCALLREPADCEALLDRADDATLSFVEDCDFETAVLLYVESIGPHSGYDAIEFASVDVADGELTAAAAAVDTAAPGALHRDVETYPAAFLRASDDPRPRRATVAVVDGWGNRSVVHAGHDGDSSGLRRVR